MAKELKAIGEALTARFGWSAFSDRADQYAEKQMIARMPEGVSLTKCEELTALFSAVRRFNDQQRLAERRNPSRTVTPAAYDPAISSESSKPLILPMLAAVTEFKASVDEEAKTRVLELANYKQQRAVLAETARRVWRDPAGAVTEIENLVTKRVEPERIARAVENEPSAYGPLRGSNRMIDRLLAPGRERKTAIEAVPTVADNVVSFGNAWQGGFKAERAAVMLDRGRMGIPIPGLSLRAEVELLRLTVAAQKSPKNITQLVQSLDAMVRAEFATVSKALDKRFGTNAIGRRQDNVADLVPESQRKMFESILPRLQMVQKVVSTDRAQEIITERQVRGLTQAKGITR